MERKRQWVQKLVDTADLAGEPLPGVPVVEIAGENRVLIERHCGVTQYSREQVCVRVRYGCICVCGDGLVLTRMSRDQLIISGRIDCVKVQRRGK